MNELTHQLAASLKALLPSSQRVLDEIEYTPELRDAILLADLVLDRYDLDVATMGKPAQPRVYTDAQHETSLSYGMACWEPEPDVSPRSPVGLIVFAVLLLAAVALGVTQAPQCRDAGTSTTLLCAD